VKGTGNRNRVLALIPARGGSRSIPDKNLAELNGHPLVAYSIAAAQMSRLIGRIIVSTDSPKIAETARLYGAEVPFMRPKRISGHKAVDIDLFRHAYSWLERNEGTLPELAVHLRPTTPLRDPALIDRAVRKMMSDRKATALRSAHATELTPYKMFTIRSRYCSFFGSSEFERDEEYYNSPRQRFPPAYIPNGHVDVLRPEVLEKTGMLHGKRIFAFITEKLPDIDGPEDLEYARRFAGRPEHSALLSKLEEVRRNAKLS
jgi:N-acylneuraminate cytidylyltransferase